MGTYHTPISEVHLMDCMELMRGKPAGFWDLGIIDPPYGIGEDGASNHSRGKIAVAKKYTPKSWDASAPPAEYFRELRRVTKNQIIWGANHFISRLPLDSPSWIVWDKVNGATDFADCELAWTSFKSAVRRFEFKWQGMLQGNMKSKEQRIHPTQKPVALYEWLLKNYSKPGDKILDTHLGSGSSRIAAYKMGFDFWGCEIDPDYYRDSEKRFKEAIAMPLFDAVPMAEQLTLC